MTTSNNVDVSFEHYFQTVGVASGGFFYKKLSDYSYQATLQQTIGSDLYRISQPVNGDSANIYRLDVYTNFTYVHSNATLPRGPFILPGQASHLGNAAISYERRGLSARASFNYQGHYVLAIGNTAADDNWLDNRLEIDFSVSHRINKRIRVFFDALNLGNEPYRVYIGTPNRSIQGERYKIWAITGFKFDF